MIMKYTADDDAAADNDANDDESFYDDEEVDEEGENDQKLINDHHDYAIIIMTMMQKIYDGYDGGVQSF